MEDRWYQEIKEELKRRDKRCKLKYGPNNAYIHSSSINPYFYPDVETFNRENEFIDPFKKYNKDCKLIKNTYYKKLDDNSRYYKDIKYGSQCKMINGIWDETGVNRDNKYERGVCWLDEKNMKCGKKIEKNILRPELVRKTNETTIKDELNKCNLDNDCESKQTGRYSYDCFAKNIKKDEIEKDKEKKYPPEDMPTENIEKYLKDLYLNNKPYEAPETDILIGEGNRCKKNIEKSNNEKPTEVILRHELDENAKDAIKHVMYIRKQLLLYNPTKDSDYKFLKKYISEEKLKEYKNHYIKNKKQAIDNLSKYSPEYFGEKFINHIKNISDEKIEEEIKKNIIDTKPKLTVPQSIVHMVMSNIAKKKTSAKGLLAFHSTGSGKTCTAACVFDAFWDTDRDIIFCSSKDAISTNGPKAFMECGQRFFKRFNNKSFEEISDMYNNRNIRYLTFTQLANRIKGIGLKKNEVLNLNNSILVMDEVQNLFHPLPNQVQDHFYLQKHINDPTKYPKLKIVILTATPGDSVEDTIKLLNIVRDPYKLPIKVPDINSENSLNIFKESIRGTISFFDMSGDKTKFPKVNDDNFYRYPMSEKQFEAYVEAYKKTLKDNRVINFDELVKNNQAGKYWIPARRYSNMMYNLSNRMQLKDFSSKLPHLLENIEKHKDEKHYVYTAFYERKGYGGHGIIAIAKQLEKHGYKKLTVAEAKKLNSENKLLPAGKRYIMAISAEIGNAQENSKMVSENLNNIIKIFNSEENKEGKLIHVFLASQNFNEGLDLKAVRHIHIFEPLVTMANDKQTIGRAARQCSHSQLNLNKWDVNIHRYLSDIPDKYKSKDDKNKSKLEEELIELNNKILKVEKEIEYLRELKKGGNNPLGKKINIPILKPNKEIKKTKPPIKPTKPPIKEVKPLKKIIKKIKQDEILDKNQSPLKLLKEELIKLKHEKVELIKKIKSDVSDIKNIEDFIYNESRERFKIMTTLYQAMKEVAIDCTILNKFHSNITPKINCYID